MLALDNLCTTEYHDSDNKAPESHNTAFSYSLRRYTIMNSKFSYILTSNIQLTVAATPLCCITV